MSQDRANLDAGGSGIIRPPSAYPNIILAAPTMLVALCEVEDYLDDRADVDDGIPNDAMRLLVEVREAIAKAKKER